MTLAVPKISEGLRAEARQALARVQDKNTSVADYRVAMGELGRLLGRALTDGPISRGDSVCLAMTVEDADFLGAGVLSALEEAGVDVAVACFWNDRRDAFDLEWAELAPVVQEYREPLPDKVEHIVILKSVISGACVVKSNLEHLFDEVTPESVHVAAPVMLEGADERLEQNFPAKMASQFTYWMFEVDHDRTDLGEVVPGIGGEIYERLGLGTKASKNAFIPRLVRERRRAAA